MGFFQLLRSVAVVSIMSSGLVLTTSFLFSLWMDREDFGEYIYWYSIYLILLNVVQFGAVAACGVYRYELKYDEYKIVMVKSLYAMMPICLIGVFLALYLFDVLFFENQIAGVLYLAPFAAYFYANTLVLITICRVEQDLKYYSVLFVILAFFLFAFQVSSYRYFETLHSVLISFVVAQFLFYIYSNFVFIRNRGFSLDLLFSTEWSLIDRLSYGLPLVISSVAMSLLTMADRIYLKGFVPSDEYGTYSTIVLVASSVLFLANNFAMAWGGFLFKRLPSMSNNEISEFFLKGQKYIFLVLALALIILIPLLLVIYKFIYGEVSSDFNIALVMIGVGYVIYGVSKFYIGYLMAYKKNAEVLKATLFGILIASCAFFIQLFDPVITASSALAIGFFCQFIYVTVFVNLRLRGEWHVL